MLATECLPWERSGAPRFAAHGPEGATRIATVLAEVQCSTTCREDSDDSDRRATNRNIVGESGVRSPGSVRGPNAFLAKVLGMCIF